MVADENINTDELEDGGGGLFDSDDDLDLEAQMSSAMAAEDDDDELGAQIATALGGEDDINEGESLLEMLSEDPDYEKPVRPVSFQQLSPTDEPSERQNISRLLDVGLQLSVELGRKKMQIKEILDLGPGKIIELDKLAGEPVDLLVNGRLLARGEVVVVDENFGIRITDLIEPKDRVRSL